MLDQPYHIHAHIPWESQFEYFVAHNDAGKVCNLLDMIPNSILSEGIIRVNVDSLQAAANTLSDLTFPDYSMYICDSEELEPVCMEIPHVKVFRSLCNHESTLYIRMVMQQELAKKHIFMKEYWQSTTEIIPLLARAGILIKVGSKEECSTTSFASEMPDDAHHQGREGALHKLIIRFCVQYNLPYLLDLYLDICNLAPEKDCIRLLKETAVSSGAILVYNTCYSTLLFVFSSLTSSNAELTVTSWLPSKLDLLFFNNNKNIRR